MARTHVARFDAQGFLTRIGTGRTTSAYRKKQVVFGQGAPADAVFYVQTGRIKLTVVSEHGKSAVVAVPGPGDFFGEGCLAGQPLRMATASVVADASIVRIDKKAMITLLHRELPFTELFMAYLLARNIRIEEDLMDQLFNSTEKRLARVLLLLTRFGKEGTSEPVMAKLSQETLAEIVGTTRSRVSVFMNKFRKLGFIEYNGGLRVHSSLVSVIVHE